METTRIAKEIVDVFPTDLPCVLLYRDIDFVIDVEPCTKPISIAPYQMTPTELKELKEKLEDLLKEG